MAESFRELRGHYVENAGQTINLREYLDYFEPLGSALARLPDGVGGPFVHHFTGSGGRTIGSIGWVVSAASKRFGAWTLWGMWSERPIPAVALPLFWNSLHDPARTAEVVERANDDAERLLDRRKWPSLLGRTEPLDERLRVPLTTMLERAWSVPPPHKHSIEVELTSRTLDLLPWLYILGPVDPTEAQLQPSRFNGAGYQYILDQPPHAPARGGIAPAFDVGELVDTAAADVVAGWRMANDLRANRGRPPKAAAPPPRPQRKEKPTMRSEEPSPKRPKPSEPPPEPTADTGTIANAVTMAYRILVIALLAWIAWNLNVIRKNTTPAQPSSPAAVTETEPESTTAPEPEPAPTASAPAPNARIARIANALAARPPRNMNVSKTVMNDIAQGGAGASDQLARAAVEVFLRRNGCFTRGELIDGQFSTAEQRAIRNCALLQDERLMKTPTQPDETRAIAWLQGLLAVE